MLAFLARCGTRTCPVLVHTTQYGPRPGHCTGWVAAHSMCYVHSWMSCPSCHTMTVLPACPTPVALSYLPCPICPVHPVFSAYPFPPLLSQLSCSSALVHSSAGHGTRSLCPVLPDLSRMTCQANQFRRHVPDVMPNFTVMAVLSRLSNLNCPVPAALSFCHVLAILSSLSCPACTIPTFSSCPVLTALSWLSCPGFPVLAVLPQHSCSQLFFPTLLYLLSCFHCPVLSVVSYMPCPRNPTLTVLYWLSRAVLTWLIKN